MTKKLLAGPLVLTLVVCICAIPAFANGPKASEPGTSPEIKETSAKRVTKSNTKLERDMEKLVNEAKAGRVAPRSPQFPQTSRSNLSKTTKIALIATAVGTSIFLIVMFHQLSKD